MHSLTIDSANIHERMDRIEKQNRRLKSALFIVALSFLALALMGAKSGPHDGHFRNIVAQGLSIVDSAGHEIIVLGSRDGAVGLRVMNKDGQRVVGLGINADESGSGMLIADDQGRPRIGLGVEEELPSMAIVNERGKKIVAIGGDDRGYGLAVMDDNEVERVALGFKEGASGFALYDEQGQYLRGLIRQRDGVHYSSFVDENGEEVILR